MGGRSGGAKAGGVKGAKGAIGRLVRAEGFHEGPQFGLPESETGIGIYDDSNYVSTRYSGDQLEVRGSELDTSLRGTGLGTGMYIAALQEAQRQGLGIRSDTRSLSKEAKRVWEGLRARLPRGAMERGRVPSGRYPQYTISASDLRNLGPNFDWNTLRSGTPRRSTYDPNTYPGYA